MITKMYSREDAINISSLARVVSPTFDQMESIFHMHKKYINPSVTTYTSSCSTCGNSIVVLWRLLINWYNTNSSLFDQE